MLKLNNFILNNVKLLQNKLIILNEEYGIKNIRNKKYLHLCNNISKQVKNLLNEIYNSSEVDYNILLVYDDNEYYAKELSFNIKDIPYLNKINIFVGSGLFKQNNQVYRNNESINCVITDTGYYNFNDNNDLLFYNSKYKIIKEISENKKIIINPFIISKNKIDVCSIFISVIPEDLTLYTEKYISSILMHELGHLYDLYIQNINIEQLNNDIFITSFAVNNEIYKNDIYKIINKFNNFIISNNKKYILKNNFTIDDIIYFIFKYIEVLNISELHQYLINFKYELDKIKPKKLFYLYKHKNINTELFLYQLSNIFKERYDLLLSLKMFKKYIPNEVKQEFANIYIKNYFNIKIKNNFLLDINLKENNVYNEKSFDKLIDIFINRITNIFIKNAFKIFMNKSQKSNNLIVQKDISKQVFKNLIK